MQIILSGGGHRQRSMLIERMATPICWEMLLLSGIMCHASTSAILGLEPSLDLSVLLSTVTAAHVENKLHPLKSFDIAEACEERRPFHSPMLITAQLL